MENILKSYLQSLLICFCFIIPQWTSIAFSDEAGMQKAKAFFEHYMVLEKNFDPAIVDLYSDDAEIKNTRRYPDGQTHQLSMEGAEYKIMIRDFLGLSKRRSSGDT